MAEEVPEEEEEEVEEEKPPRSRMVYEDPFAYIHNSNSASRRALVARPLVVPRGPRPLVVRPRLPRPPSFLANKSKRLSMSLLLSAATATAAVAM